MKLEHQQRSRYRADLDGLRAVAVVGVILFHFGLDGFPGGFVGVDVFFVISGYLITQKLMVAHERGGISFREFYLGRVRRLLPALYATLLGCAVAAMALMQPVPLRAFGRSLAAAVLSLANVLFWSEAGYWDAASETKPLLHTWSLSVEEQFYLVWPLLLLVLLSLRSRRALYAGFATLGVASLVAAEWTLGETASTAFFWMPFRGVEFVLGALCIAADEPAWKERTRRWPLLREVLSLGGLLAIVFSVLAYREDMRFPGVSALLPCLGTVLVIAAREGPLSGRVLKLRPVVFVGLISYSLYLVHWPVLVFFELKMHRAPEALETLPLIALTLLLSWASFRYVETPFRGSRRLGAGVDKPPLGPALFAAGAPAVGILALAAFLLASDGLAFRYDDDFRTVAAASRRQIADSRKVRLLTLCPDPDVLLCGDYDPERANIVILGDSQGLDGLNVLAAGYPGANFIVSSIGGCPPLFNVGSVAHGEPACLDLNRQRFKSLQRYPELHAVVLSMRLTSEREAALEATVRELTQRGHRVIVFGRAPVYAIDVQTIAAEHGSLIGLDEVADRHVARVGFKRDRWLAQMVESFGGTYLLRQPFFCPEDGPCRVVTRSGRELLLYDRMHLSAEGAVEYGLALRQEYPALFE